jgi:hypothetical protein
MKSGGSSHEVALLRLRRALDAERIYLQSYERPSEPIVYETLRTLDDLFCRDLMEPQRTVSNAERVSRSLSTWGVNHALRRVIPKKLVSGPFRDFPSRQTIQAQTDDFLFHCGVVGLAERLEGWLDEGIVTGKIRTFPEQKHVKNVLELRSAMSSYSDEEIGRIGLRWASDRIVAEDRPVEQILEARHRSLEPDLQSRVQLIDGWRVTYSSTREIDDYFLECAKLYLRRIFSQDMIGPEDMLGGRPFSTYVQVLSALSARSQKHIAFAAILRARYPSAHIRNLLTTYYGRELFIESLANYIGAYRSEIEDILASFILTGENLEVHTGGSQPAWARIVQVSRDMLLLPTYGLDINPFLYLLTDLRFRYETDWFRAANNRERRWIDELEQLFDRPRWQTHSRNLRLRENGKDLTDIDFAAYNTNANELALFQLKWQHPVGMDNRGRRSAGKNLVAESNRWVGTVVAWVERNGVDALMRRFGFAGSPSATIHLFVLGRYYVHLSGFEDRDTRAVWSDWAHLRRARAEGPKAATVAQIKSALQATVKESRASKIGESIAFPVGDLAVVLNPTRVPPDL